MFVSFLDINSEDGDMKFVTSHIPFPSSDIGMTVQGWFYSARFLFYLV